MRLLIQNGRVIDPANGVERICDLYVEDGKIAPLPKTPADDTRRIDAAGKVVAPGLIDLHCHLRDPGFTEKEDVFTGTAAAAAGGFTSVCCMPNTKPTISTPEVISDILKRAKQSGKTKVLPIASVSDGLMGGKLSDFTELKNAGAVAFSDDGRPVQNDAMMRAALVSAKANNFTVISHCEMTDLTAGGAINEGAVSAQLGVGGIPNSAEDIMIARDLVLAAETGAPVHIAHVSTAGGIEMIRVAKAHGVRVTCETCPHYFSLTEQAVLEKGANAKMSPPLRTARDRDAVIAGICDGTVDVIATDHAPHTAAEKEAGLQKAPNGIVGFETALSLGITGLVRPGHISLARLIEMMTAAPAALLPGERGSLSEGAAADIVIFDPEESYVLGEQELHSKSKNTPFIGEALWGRVYMTIADGKIIYQR